jgi:fatty acid desaturase
MNNSAPQRARNGLPLLLPAERKLAEDDRVRIAAIRAAIHEAGLQFRERHPRLIAHQNALGMAIFLSSIGCAVAMSALYIAGLVPWWVCIPFNAFCFSVLHELEHDLIHSLYFRTNKFAHNFMLAGVWLMRPSTINPWIRRRMHLHHHRASGTESDLEERAITNGVPWGFRRMLMTGDGMLAIYLRPFTMERAAAEFARSQAPENQAERERIEREQRVSYVPLGLIHYTLWHVFIIYHAIAIMLMALGIFFAPPTWLAETMTVVDAIAVVWLAPNALRTFCLHLVSSNMHYFGDVEQGNVLQQTQIWTSKVLLPLHIFCFNFGSTHAIHHFVVGDTFYIRQAIARDAHRAMRENGVRFNDFDTFRRANRRGEYAAETAV